MAGQRGPIDPGVDIGHVHLRVADVDRALEFYCGVLGEKVAMYTRPLDLDGLSAALAD